MMRTLPRIGRTRGPLPGRCDAFAALPSHWVARAPAERLATIHSCRADFDPPATLVGAERAGVFTAGAVFHAGANPKRYESKPVLSGS